MELSLPDLEDWEHSRHGGKQVVGRGEVRGLVVN